jgi:hypothetical protein
MGFMFSILRLDVPRLLFFCVHVFSLDGPPLAASGVWESSGREGMLEIAFKT